MTDLLETRCRTAASWASLYTANLHAASLQQTHECRQQIYTAVRHQRICLPHILTCPYGMSAACWRQIRLSIRHVAIALLQQVYSGKVRTVIGLYGLGFNSRGASFQYVQRAETLSDQLQDRKRKLSIFGRHGSKKGISRWFWISEPIKQKIVNFTQMAVYAFYDHSGKVQLLL